MATLEPTPLVDPDCVEQMGCEFQTVIAAERQHLQKTDQDTLTALAISGGGIRSASFGLGVMQALVAGNVFHKIDYLSTSSGGGYIGSSLTYFLHKGFPDGSKTGTTKDNFPFGSIGAGNRNLNESNQVVNGCLDFLRQHSLYLTPSKSLDIVALVALVLRTVSVSLLVHFSFFLTFLLVLYLTGLVNIGDMRPSWPHLNPNWFFYLAGGALTLFGVMSVLASISTHFVQKIGLPYQARVWAQVALGVSLKSAFVLLLLGSLDPLHRLLDETFEMVPLNWATGSTVLGALMGFIRRKPEAGKKPSLLSAMIPLLASSLITYGLLIGAYSLLQIAEEHHQLVRLLLCTGAVLALGYFINTNYFSLHRMYRDRLMENFMPNLDGVRDNRWGAATEADKTLLHEVCDPSINPKPYHLITTNLVLSDSGIARYGARGGDSFVLSPLYCGGDACGYIPTKKWKINGGTCISLATAMAISGASVNPNSANNSRGVTRNRLVSGLLTILSLRLGYWVSNPKRPDLMWKNPNFYTTGLFGLLFGTRLTENSRMLELTDGGHFDNVALYELIRRKVRLIIISDAGADPKFHFDDLGCTVERVRVDFGVKIRFSHPEYNLDNLQPGTSKAEKIIADKYGFARHGFAIGHIYYSDQTEGTIIYIKATLKDGLPADIYTYKSSHEAFPHEPTGDQLYDEVQFEAYRELGYQLTWTMLNALGNYTDGQWHPRKDGELKLLAE
jgi:Patatin-like phospholipase